MEDHTKGSWKTKEYSWLVKNRSLVQWLLYDLYSFGHKTFWDSKKARIQDREKLDIWMLLVGVGFSLWRAVFLIDVHYKDGGKRVRDRKQILEKAKSYLEFLLETNTISFDRDQKTQHWSVGYYLNNGRYRIEESLKMLAGNGTAGDVVNAISGKLKDLGLETRHHEQYSSHIKGFLNLTEVVGKEREAWKAIYDAATTIFVLIGGTRTMVYSPRGK